MKKLILIAVVAFAGTQANAQLSINPEAGVNFAKMQDAKTLISFKAGAVADIALSKHFYIQPGLFYSGKGAKPSTGIIKSTININYLEIPLNLGYRYDFNNSGAVFATAGPYIGIGLNGKAKLDGIADVNLKAGEDFNRIDYGMNFSVGYITPIGIYIRGQYGLGLNNVFTDKAGGGGNHSVFSVSLGYAFDLNER